MSTKRLENPAPNPGDRLRDLAADLLSSKFGKPRREVLVEGKKVDVVFEYENFGKKTRLYVEAKDLNRNLSRDDVVHICTDYHGILRKDPSSGLLVVTSRGLTTAAQEYIDEESGQVFHQTIWEIESGLIDLNSYMDHLIDQVRANGLANYYVEAGFAVRENVGEDHSAKDRFDDRKSCLSQLKAWVLDDSDHAPVAILGGYGSGKTSVADVLAAECARRAKTDPHARQPIVIKLGSISEYSNVVGILASQFTHDYPIPGYNYHHFQALNEKGRYVLILDGFDEMKHAMSWADFRAQIRGLLELHTPKSKILLLGRPSAFMSELEEMHILRGKRPVGGDWVRLPDWPRFHELELSDFTSEERRSFIIQYLRFVGKALSELAVEQRAAIANEIADENEDLFRKPVHSKILTDLATDEAFDLERFRGHASRWLLYEEFIGSLYAREADKRVRRDISTARRVQFLEDVAFWLWTMRGTSISFSASDLPESLFEGIEFDEEEGPYPLVRELLVGSILERKKGDIFYFGHRSFAEFLVAQRMLSNEPKLNDHQHYSDAFADGVLQFVTEARRPDTISKWRSTFPGAVGMISFDYINFLAASAGGIERFVEELPKASVWNELLQPFTSSLYEIDANREGVLRAMKASKSSASFAWWYLWQYSLDADYWLERNRATGRLIRDFDTHVLTALLGSLFGGCSNKDRNLFVDGKHSGLRRICDASITLFDDGEGRIEFEWSHAEIALACRQELVRSGLEWPLEDNRLLEGSIITPLAKVVQNLEGKAKGHLNIFLKHVRSWKSITELAVDEPKRREISRRNKPPRKFQSQTGQNRHR